ncbi:MAG: NYN domain-containing protein [Patescibacteria group bacterium]
MNNLEKNNNPRIGVFVDNANLFYAQKQSKWKVDIQKLKEIFLVLNTQFIRYYIAIPSQDDLVFAETQKYLDKIKQFVDIHTKPLKYINIGNKIIKKGDVDVDITVDVIESIKEYDVAVIVSGDSDYIALRDFLLRRNKKIIFMGFKNNLSYEIKKGKYILFESIRKEIELGDKKITPEFNLGRILLPLVYPIENKSQEIN